MTANDLTRRILLSIGVIGETDIPSAEQTADTLMSINQFLGSLGSEGFVTLQYTDPTADIGLDDGWDLMIQTNVAVMVAPDYGKEAPPTIKSLAASTKRTLKRRTTLTPVLNLDRERALQWRNSAGYDILTDSYQ